MFFLEQGDLLSDMHLAETHFSEMHFAETHFLPPEGATYRDAHDPCSLRICLSVFTDSGAFY